jgi:hypothetical protein
MHHIGEAAAGGAVMGVPIAGMHALGGARGQIDAAAGAVGDATKSAAQFVGDKAKGVAKVTGDAATKAGDAAGSAADAAGKKVAGMELPDSLEALYDAGKTRTKDVLDKIAKSDDVIGDITKFAGLQGEKLKQALAGDDGERLQAVRDYAKELGDQHPAVRDWMQDAGNRTKQAAVAAAKQAEDAYRTVQDRINRFGDAVDERLNERKFKRADGDKYEGGTVVDADGTVLDDGVVNTTARAEVPPSRRIKRSEDESGIREALQAKLVPELLKIDPNLARAVKDKKTASKLHRGLSGLIEELASGRQPSEKAMARLIDLAGPAADRLLEVAHSVVSDSADKAKTATFFKGLNEFTKIRDSADTLAQAQHKLLRPELQRSTSNHDLREEARLLMKWLDDKRPTEDHYQEQDDGSRKLMQPADPEAVRLKYRMEKYLETRYGENSKKLLTALEKARPKEENQIERARVKYDEDGQPIDSGVDDGFSESGSPGRRMQFFGGGRKGMDLMPHPEDDPGKGGYPGIASQKLNKVKALHPDSTPRFITATEMGLDHPWVKEKYKTLVKMGEESGVDGERFAREQLDRYGVIATERALQDTQLSFDELDAMKLDRKRYADSKSRIDTGDDGPVLDAVKVVKSMAERFEGEYSAGDDASRVARLGRMFVEGIAAVQDHLGKAFDIPDSTVLGRLDKREVTWGQVKKLDTRTTKDKVDDSVSKQLVALRKQFKATEDKALRAEIAKEAAEIDAPRQAAKNRELGREDSRMQQDDALDFEGDVERGINMDKRSLREQVRGVQKQIEEVGKLLDGEAQFGLGGEEVKLRQQLARLNQQLDGLRARQERATPGESLGSGQREIDPFGQIHQAAGYDARKEPAPINRDRTEQAPSLLGPRREKPAAEKPAPPDDGPPLSAYDDAPYRDGSAEQVSQDTVDRVAEQRQAWIADALKEDVATFKARATKLDAERLGRLVESMETMDRPAGIPPGRWRTALDHARTQLEQGDPTGPKAVAAKKAAFLERARSGDETLIKEIAQHTDAVGLQNAVIHLARSGDVTEPNTARTIDALNARIGELVKSEPQQAYDMLRTDRSGGKKYSLEQMKRKPITQDKEALDLMAKMGWQFDELSLERFSTRSRETAWRAMLNEALTIKDVRDASRLNDGTWGGKGKALSHLNGILADRYGSVTEELGRRMKDMPTEMDLAAAHFGPMEDTRSAGEKARDRMADRTRTLQIASRTDEALEGMAHSRAEGELWQDQAEADMEGVAYDEANAERDRARHFARELKKLQAERERARKEAPGWEQHASSYDEGEDYSFSMEQVTPGATGPVNRKEVYDHIHKTLGNSVRVAWANLLHAGEFERVNLPRGGVEDVIRLSIHSMNPLSTAYHESLHAFMQKLSDMKQGQVMDVLLKAGESAHVLDQLRTWMKDRGMGDAALAQLRDPEERAAYMYQAWAEGKLKITGQPKTVLGKIADFIRSVLGTWSNDERALHILDYFHSGEFARNMGDRDKVRADLMDVHRNKAIETARKMTQPILNLGENLAVAGHQRLRDTGIPALRELADAMKLHTVAEGDDPGFLPAARTERTRVMNRLAADLKGFSPESIQAALESLQRKSNAPIAAMAAGADRGNAHTAKIVVRKLLDNMYDYMTDAGVKVNDMGVGKDYFPRVYDTSYISSHQQEFKNVLARHGVKNTDKVLAKIMVTEGAEFNAEVDKPGMQHLKPRDLAHIPEAELAPFMRKNLNEILNGYVTQATRRAEWARRFGDKGEVITKLLEQAKQEGATPEDLDSAQKFVRAVDGTLGDTINPEARRLFGNLIVYQNVRLLPLMIFSSLVDPMGIAVRGGTTGEAFNAFKRGISEIPKNFKKNPTDDAATKFAASIGTIDDASLVHTLGALYSQGMVGDTGRKINDTLFRYNLAEQFNTSMRVSATEAAMGFLARHADGTASRHSARWLNELGLNPGDIQLDASGRPKVFQHEGLTLEQSAKMKAAINRWVDGAVLRPDAADKPIWMSDPHFSLIAHLKQFTYSFHETILKRVAHEYQNGNYTPAMALASYVPMMIAADMAKGMIQGGGSQPSWKDDWGMGDYIASGIERAGLLGVGQFGVDMLRDAARGGTGVGALVGPTIEQLADAARVMGGREAFGSFALKSMPANALYAGALGGEGTDPKFVD